MKLRSVLALCLLFAVAACSSNKNKDELKRSGLADFDATVKIKRDWGKGFGSGRDKRASNLMAALDEQRLFVADAKGRVYAYDLERKKNLWKSNVDSDIAAGVGLGRQNVYVGTFKGELIALDAETGEQKWLAETSSEILSVPATSSTVVVAQTIDGRLYGFSTRDGKQLWRYDHAVPALTLRGTANPVVQRNQVIAAFANGQIVALNVRDGALLWSGRVSSPKGRHDLEKMIDIDGSPIIDGGMVYAATYQGALASFSKAKGQVLWKQDLSSYRNLAVDGAHVYAVTDESHVVAFNAANGSILWTNEQMQMRGLDSPLLLDNYVLVIDDDDYLHVLNKADGSFAGRRKLSGDGFSAPMLFVDGGFLALSDDGKVSIYSLKP
ncbi:outer membrane protein assembly factor BamB [Agaribacterium haliotis]|uniref:outer membrane protein assembly factor BamB n=1 Tax=Agaribacterium haliotis TaxID=2013869 RepID=UPI000BB56911|nr:outer membrane protein assembly factor BamB [Agaribacterium haliotis]